MKIALINGSPKVKDSSSISILNDLKPFLEKDNTIVSEFHFNKPQISEKEMEELAECKVWAFAFPLYVDGIPSHLLSCLTQLETYFRTNKEIDITVYALVNCGFHEGHQNRLAIEMMENWCIKAGLKWGQGIGIGAGGMLAGLKNVPVGRGPKKNLYNIYKELTSNIVQCNSGETEFTSANFPRFLYKIAAEFGWRQSAKANGLKRKDLFFRK